MSWKIKLDNPNAKHDRCHDVKIEYGDCNACSRTTQKGLSIDSSDGEYGGVFLCDYCLKLILNQIKNSSWKTMPLPSGSL